MAGVEKINKCLVCNHATFTAIDLGMHAYADTFISLEEYGKSEPVIPLSVDVCKNCGNAQTTFRTDPKDRYNLYKYSYTSSNSAFSRSYWEEYAKFLKKNYNLKGMSILEIGCNDGFLLRILRNLGANVTGIDASKEMTIKCQELGINVHQCIFGAEELPKQISVQKFDIILANNVMNHSDDPVCFVSTVASLLNDHGVFIAEQPYWAESLSSLQLDQIYHEHVSYMTVKSTKKLFEIANLNLLSATRTSYHGGSIRLIGSNVTSSFENSEIDNYISKENLQGIFEKSYYTKIMRQYELKRIEILSKILLLRRDDENIKIVGFGAAAKGNTFLTYMRLDSTIIDFLVDISPSKIGKYAPLSRIPIYHEEELANYRRILLIPLSWNLPEAILTSVAKKYKNVEWL